MKQLGNMSEHIEENGNETKDQSDFHQPKLNEVAQKFLADLEEEKKKLDAAAYPICAILIDEAYDRVCSTGRIPGKEFHADVYKQKPMKISQKVFVPVKQYPKFNFTGKILGPKGNSLRRLQEETQCKIAIKGRNSMRDRNAEEELRNLNEPRYAHLNKDLYLEISTVAAPAESYARVAYALAEIRKYLVPDKNDEVSHEQLRELMKIDPQMAKRVSHTTPQMHMSVLDKKMTEKVIGAAKYQRLIEHTTNVPVEEMDEDPYQYVIMEKRPMRPSYGHYKAQESVQPNSVYKRPPPTGYGTEIKRLREAPGKPYLKPNPYSIIKKYKQ